MDGIPKESAVFAAGCPERTALLPGDLRHHDLKNSLFILSLCEHIIHFDISHDHL
jgi:hypothetical protein